MSEDLRDSYKSLRAIVEEAHGTAPCSEDEFSSAERNTIGLCYPKDGFSGSGLLLTGDGYFVSSAHIIPEAPKGGSHVHVPGYMGDFEVERICVISRSLDVFLAKANFGNDPTPKVKLSTRPPIAPSMVEAHSSRADQPMLEGMVLGKCEGYAFTMSNAGELKVQNRLSQVGYLSTLPLDKGYSGGPIVDLGTGRVIGITSAMTKNPSRSFSGFEERSLFVPSRIAVQLIEAYLRTKD